MLITVRLEEFVAPTTAWSRFVEQKLRGGRRKLTVTSHSVTIDAVGTAAAVSDAIANALGIDASCQRLTLRGGQMKAGSAVAVAGDEVVCTVSRPRVVYITPKPDDKQVESLGDSSAFAVAHNTSIEPSHGNSITTAAYTWWNFVPLFLIKELNPKTKFANFYFLIVCCLQLVTPVSVTNGQPLSLMPLVCVLGFQALLDIKETVQKAWGDRITNAAPILVLDRATGDVVPKQWSDIVVGDVVKVIKKVGAKDPNGVFPADLIFVASSAPQLYHAQVNTKSLDGETDNKMRKALQRVQADLEATTTAPDFNDAAWEADVRRWAADPNGALCNARVECEHPNNKTNDFSGRIVYGGAASSSEPLAIDQILLRGCLLVQADWVYGIVITTGVDAKINFIDDADSIQVKRCSLEQVVNQQIVLIVGLLVIVCAIGGIGFASFSSEVWPVFYLNDHTSGSKWLEKAAKDINNEARADRYGVPGLGAFMMCFTYFLLNYQFIPVSLYVTMGGVRTIQKIFMEKDALMYDEDEEEPMIVRTLELNDELGQVSHIFSDKTGTLTNNMMVFRKFWCGGKLYGHGITDIGFSNRKAAGEDMAHYSELMREENRRPRGAGYHRFVSFLDCDGIKYTGEASLAADLAEAPVGTPGSRAAKLRMFAVAMALNQTCEMEAGPPEDLSGSSPDEKAFVAAAGDIFGVRFERHDQVSNSTLIEIDGTSLSCKILEKGDGFKYTSSRKRMSLIVRIPDNGVADLTPGIWVLSKGADSVIYESLAVDASGEQIEAADRDHLEHVHSDWADDALRGLVFAGKHLEESEYATWSASYDRALNNEARITDVTEKKRFHNEVVMGLVNEMETGLTLLGASACEDKLQRQVPDCIEVLMEAGISLWMITGDKVGTAKNIAVACRLLLPPERMRRVLLTEPDIDGEMFPEDAPALVQEGRMLKFLKTTQLAEIGKEYESDPEKAIAAMDALKAEFPGLALIESRLRKEAAATMVAAVFAGGGGGDDDTPSFSPDGVSSAKQGSSDAIPLALVIDEKAIDYIMNPVNNRDVDDVSSNLKELLLRLSLQCKSVVACRARKDQKKTMTLLIKEGVPGSVTLSIGDGANDVDMITAAHIGVAVIGKEGREAVNNSDFAIGQFRFLARLLLVHGRLNYYRMSKVIPFIFYKNVILVLAQFWFSSYAAFSGQKFYPEAGLQCFNTWLTAWPIVMLGVFDRDVSDVMAMRYPKLYEDGIYKRFFSASSFWAWQAEALFISFITFMFVVHGTDNMAFSGAHVGVWEVGALIFTLVVITVNTRVSLEMSRFPWAYHLVWWGFGPVLWFSIAFGYSSVAPVQILTILNDMTALDFFVKIANMPTSYFLIPLVLIVSMARAFFFKGYVRGIGLSLSIGPKREFLCGPKRLCSSWTKGRITSCCGMCCLDRGCCAIGPRSKYEQAIFPIEISRPRLYHLVQEVQLNLASDEMEAALEEKYGLVSGGSRSGSSGGTTSTPIQTQTAPHIFAAAGAAATASRGFAQRANVPPTPPNDSSTTAAAAASSSINAAGVPQRGGSLSLGTVLRLKTRLIKMRKKREAASQQSYYVANEEASQFNSCAVSEGHKRRMSLIAAEKEELDSKIY